MRTLAIECATEACSIALFDDDHLIASDHRILGRGHAEHLVPMIAALPLRGKADRILVSLGPGSFTGVRIGIAVAQTLAIAWRAEVLGYPTLSLVAAMAIEHADAGSTTVCMAGGHGEWFVQDFTARGVPTTDLSSLPPADAVSRGAATLLSGTRAGDFAAMLPTEHAVSPILPDAKCVHLIDETRFDTRIVPIYGRGPDARLPA